MTAETTALLALETQRCNALMEGDRAALAALLRDDLVHVHMNGKADDLATYLDGVGGRYRFHNIRRSDMVVRVIGDCAVMTGVLDQELEILATGERRQMHGFVTQTWHREGEGWRQGTCHVAPLTYQPAS
ncbi:nuclear transport factor 2 family protein [Falsigemmobacter intermedius]|uniref:Nuclear transport factor 2 family protein n=1 Tax=Falsigemmobacter intermedius TaxID=1553448 RepID=A0A444MB91_9RHOB|nr:nuclear transport factor 2 family protein [Falsigemmobacter intermedius]RWY40995.1 nuclear transport factor 2 family protein [Falsigemmobacter intermedius]